MVAGRSHRLLLDTGAARTRLNPTDGIDRLPALASDPSYTAFGSLRSEPLVRVREVSFGSVRLDTLEVVRSTTPGDELLGVDALEGHRLHFRFSSAVLEIDAPQLDAPTNELLRDDRGHIYVDVTWPGASARACWDTGASATVVDAGFWHRHPQLFEPIGQSAGTDAGGSEVAAPLLQMAEAVIGRRPFRPHPVVAADLTGVNRTLDLPMDLILGFPTISQADWLFDLPRRLWAITS
jgi:predicted aspartyl protease